MTLLEEIDNIHIKFADGKIDLHNANMETSRRLAQARQELLDASRIVLERTGQIDHTQAPKAPTYQPTFDEPFSSKQRQSEKHINSGQLDDFLLSSAMLLREWLDAFIETRERIKEQS